VSPNQIISKDILNSKELFVEQQKTVMDHLGKHARDLLNTKVEKFEGAIFPSMEIAIEKLKKLCETHNIDISKKEEKPAEIFKPAKWAMDDERNKRKSSSPAPEFPKVSLVSPSTPTKAIQRTPTPSLSPGKPQVSLVEEKKVIPDPANTFKIEQKDFHIAEDILEKFSDLDKLIFSKLREEYNRISKMSDEVKESPPRSKKDVAYLVNLINAYIHMTTSTVSTDDTLLKSQEKDGESESKDGSHKERKFELFNQRYKVALAPQSSLYKGIQARRARSVHKNLAKGQVGGVQSDKSYSHTSK